ncbi:MAG TPA: transcriptional regulator, partial [Pyrinomonadaceae bacterium]
MSSLFKQFYEFGPFVLDVSERLLLREGRPVHLTPKEFETLLALVRGAGRVIRKEELLKEIWPDTFVGEATLAQNVFTLRKALGEAEGGGAFIETVPRRGYRFAVKVTGRREGEEPPATVAQDAALAPASARADDESRALIRQDADPGATPEDGGPPPDSSNAAPAARTSPPDARAAESGNGRAPSAVLPSAALPSASDHAAHARTHDGHPVRAAVLISVALFASVAALVYFIHRSSVRPDVERARAPAPGFQQMKVTRLPATGSVAEAVISPDGNYLAYVATEPGRQGAGVWVRQVEAASNTQQLVAPAEGAFYGALVFSPDSRHLYYGEAREGSQ